MFKFDKKFLVLPVMICLMFATLCTFGFAGCSTEKIKVTIDADGGYFVIKGQENDTTHKTYTVEIDKGSKVDVDKIPEAKKDSATLYEYAFDGYSIDLKSTTFDKDTTVRVKWAQTDRLYTVTFSAGDGSFAPGDGVSADGKTYTAKVKYNTVIKSTEIPVPTLTKTGYTCVFKSWSDVTVTASASYTAAWTETQIDYTVTYNANGGKIKDADKYTATLHYENSVALGEGITLTGPDESAQYKYEFAGWFDAADETGKMVTTVPANNTTLYAHWTQITKEYTITFYASGGFAEGGNSVNVAMRYGDTIQYTLTGNQPKEWKDNTTIYTFDKFDITEGATVTGNATINAKYNEATRYYTVTFDAGDGYFGTSDVKSKTVTDLKWGAKITAPTGSPTIAETDEYSYKFEGYDGYVERGDGQSTVTGENMKFVAKYTTTKRSYNVSFVDGDGKDIATSTLSYGATINIPANAVVPTKASTTDKQYTFTCYKLVKDGETGDALVAGQTTVTGTMKFVAQFQESTRVYDVVFNAGEGAYFNVENHPTTYTLQVEYGATPNVQSLPEVVRPVDANDNYTSAYTFNGWGTVMAVEGTNLSYTAQFTATPKTYTVTFIDSETLGKTIYSAEFTADEKGQPALTEIQYSALETACKNANIKLVDDNGFVGQWSFELKNYNCTFSITGDGAVYTYGNGTVSNPYLINDLDSFKAMMTKLEALYKTYSGAPDTAIDSTPTKSAILSAAAGVYYQMIDDVDFSDYKGNTCSWFVGHLDAKKDANSNYAIKGMDPNMFMTGEGAIFEDIYNATISNLDIILGDQIVSFASVARGESVTFDNVNVRNATNGAVTLITSDDNNESAYVCFSKAASMTFKNCTNYANYVSETSYFGIFLGGYAGDRNTVTTESKLTFEGCVNYGDVLSSDAVGMLYGNPCARNFAYSGTRDNADGSNEISIKNCVNYGSITARQCGGFVGFSGVGINSTQMEFLNTLVQNGTQGDKVGSFNVLATTAGTLSYAGNEFILSADQMYAQGTYVVTFVIYAYSQEKNSTVRVNYSYTVNLTESATSIAFGGRYDFIDLTNYNKLPNHVTFESADWKQMTGYKIYYAFDENSRYVVFNFNDFNVTDYVLNPQSSYKAYITYYDATGKLSSSVNSSVSAYTRADVSTAVAFKTAISDKKQIINVTADIDFSTSETAYGQISGISIDHDCVINLGGNTITAAKGFDLANSTTTARLTLNNGKLNATYWAAWVQKNGVLTLNNIEVTSTGYDTTIFVGGDASNAKTYNPQVILNNGTKVYNTFGTTNANNVTSAIALFDGATLTMNNGSFVHYGYTGKATVDTGAGVYVSNANVTINSGAIVDSKGFGVYAEKGANVTINGRVVSTQYALVTNGFDANASGSTISVNAGSEVVSTRSTAMYIASKDDVTISGGTIHGATALYIKSGDVTVTGGTFMAWLDKTSDYAYMNSGCHATGDAIVIDACGYTTGAPKVTISGATFTKNAQGADDVYYVQYGNSAVGTVTVNGTDMSATTVTAVDE